MHTLPHGLLRICLLDGTGGLQRLEPKDLGDWTSENGCLWLHFDLTSSAAAQWLRGHPDLDPIVVESLLSVDSRPRLNRVGSGALLAFRGVNHHEGAAPADMIGIRLWLDEHLIITTQRRWLQSVTDLFESLETGRGPSNAPGVVVELTERLVSRMSDTVDDLEEQIADLEAATLEEAKTETRAALSHLRRQLIALRRYLAPQREALSSLVASKFSWLDERDRLALRETGDQLIRHLEDLDAIRERAAVTQEELQNRPTHPHLRHFNQNRQNAALSSSQPHSKFNIGSSTFGVHPPPRLPNRTPRNQRRRHSRSREPSRLPSLRPLSHHRGHRPNHLLPDSEVVLGRLHFPSIE
jgi:zinc transporter